MQKILRDKKSKTSWWLIKSSSPATSQVLQGRGKKISLPTGLKFSWQCWNDMEMLSLTCFSCSRQRRRPLNFKKFICSGLLPAGGNMNSVHDEQKEFTSTDLHTEDSH